MGRRERLERRLAKREEWAASRERKGEAALGRAHDLVKDIPLGQPILVGHHSEKRHRRVLEKSDNAMRQGFEHMDMAKHHAAKASGLATQLDTAIFSDDPDALEQLDARIAELEEKRDRKKRVNAAFRKGDDAFAEAMGCTVEEAVASRIKINENHSWCRQPYPAYELQNLGGNIRRLKQRKEEIERQAARQAKAEEAGVLIEGEEWVRVTFPERPEREILAALREAQFHFGSGSWSGQRVKLPACVLALVQGEEEATG